MNAVAAIFVAASSAAVLALPRRYAIVPVLAGACYMTLGQAIEIGPFTFTVVRLLVLAGIVRVFLRHERLPNGINGLDVVIAILGTWVCFCAPFHNAPETGLVYRLGVAFNACGLYFLARLFCTSPEDLIRVCRVISLVLIPVALAMVFEHLAMYNAFSFFGGVSAIPHIRQGHVRASGPFLHPILAGTVGGVCLPMSVALWKVHKLSCAAGTVACVAIVLSSRSSGPLLTAVLAVASLSAWPMRRSMRALRWSALAGYVALDLVMKAPAYYLMGRIDLAGGSTGWHRAALIESALKHLREWWVVGTDSTRHWMPTGVSWNANHTDITNYYLLMGVLGGLPLMVLFIGAMTTGFSYVGRGVAAQSCSANDRFVAWALGASLFAHAASCLAVAYFDQSVVFLYSTLGVIGSTFATLTTPPAINALALTTQRRFHVQRLKPKAHVGCS